MTCFPCFRPTPVSESVSPRVHAWVEQQAAETARRRSERGDVALSESTDHTQLSAVSTERALELLHAAEVGKSDADGEVMHRAHPEFAALLPKLADSRVFQTLACAAAKHPSAELNRSVTWMLITHLGHQPARVLAANIDREPSLEPWLMQRVAQRSALEQLLPETVSKRKLSAQVIGDYLPLVECIVVRDAAPDVLEAKYLALLDADRQLADEAHAMNHSYDPRGVITNILPLNLHKIPNAHLRAEMLVRLNEQTAAVGHARQNIVSALPQIDGARYPKLQEQLHVAILQNPYLPDACFNNLVEQLPELPVRDAAVHATVRRLRSYQVRGHAEKLREAVAGMRDPQLQAQTDAMLKQKIADDLAKR